MQGDIALSGVIGALSYALDITEGQPEGHALRSCAIGMRIAQELALPGAVRSDLFYALLLKDAGCSANAERMAALFGADDRDAKRTSKLVDWSSPWQSLRWSLRTVAPGGSVRERVARLQGIRDEGEVTRKLLEARCDRGAEVARMLYVRWFDPVLVDALEAICRDCDFWASLGEADVANWEPSDRVLRADDERVDRIAEAFARVIDAKSPFTASHSVRVAEIAVGIGELLGFDPVVQRDLRRAGLLHDIGKLAISNRILDKPGKLTDDEFVTIQEHPAYSLRVLEHAPCFGPIADLAANHHERIDGTGYPRGLAGEALDLPMRVLAVADVYEALTADRPYRGPMPVEKALDIVSWDVPGRLDRAAFGALEAWLGRSTEPAAAGEPLAPVAPAPDPLAPGVLTLGVPASGVPAQHLSAGPAAPETRPVVPPSGAPCV